MNRRQILAAASTGLLPAVPRFGWCAEETVLDSMDAPTFRALGERVHIEAVQGKVGGALRFRYDADCRSTFAAGRVRGASGWDAADGFSFWVKGDGSDHLGGLQLIWNEDYAARYDFAFPISGNEWQKVTVAWRDLVPVLPAPSARPLDPKNGNPPSRISQWWFGKWWYWKDYAAHSFAVDDIRLEPHLPLVTTDYRPSGDPLARIRAKVRGGRPVTLVTMGDSLTDYAHWANRQTNWPTLLTGMLKAKTGTRVTVVNPAIGGTQLRQNLVLIPRWRERTPEPDLVTVWFGGNDWEAGMRGPMFREACADAVARIRRATNGRADVLLMTTCPSAQRWDTMAELAEAVRAAAREQKAGLADLYQAFHKAEGGNRARLYVQDQTHLSPAGHALTAETLLFALAG